MTRIMAATGARLHFGLILSHPGAGWDFGGIGLMVEKPGWKLVVQQASRSAAGLSGTSDQIIGGTQETQRRLELLMERLRSQSLEIPPLEIRVQRQIPPHAGLGSGTQLALALTAAAGWLATGRLPPAAEALAVLCGRRERSAIGTAGFDCGGFLIDHGRFAPEPRVERITIPDNWRFVLVRPLHSEGLSGPAEQQWFQSRREMPGDLTDALAGIICNQLVPAISSGDAAGFAAAIEAYGDAAGGFYAFAQGGIFSHPAIRQLVAELRSAGIRGAAQSSWGPGICIPADSPEAAADLLKAIPAEINGHSLEAICTPALNTGALIACEAPEDRGRDLRGVPA
jgi:beta-RFAP synthase